MNAINYKALKRENEQRREEARGGVYYRTFIDRTPCCSKCEWSLKAERYMRYSCKCSEWIVDPEKTIEERFKEV